MENTSILLEDGAFAEALIELIHDQCVTDEEPYRKKAQHLLASYCAHQEIIDNFMISLCGWSMTTLIDMTKKQCSQNTSTR